MDSETLARAPVEGCLAQGRTRRRWRQRGSQSCMWVDSPAMSLQRQGRPQRVGERSWSASSCESSVGDAASRLRCCWAFRWALSWVVLAWRRLASHASPRLGCGTRTHACSPSADQTPRVDVGTLRSFDGVYACRTSRHLPEELAGVLVALGDIVGGARPLDRGGSRALDSPLSEGRTFFGNHR